MPRHHGTRALTGALALTLAAGLVGAPGGAHAAPAVDVHAAPLATHPGDGAPYPRQQPLPEPPVDDTDAALRPGLTAYHDISRRLNAVMQTSDRVSAEVLTETGAGRDVVLVTLTAPESRGQARQQQRLRDLITDDPARAAEDRRLKRDYKLPVFINGNIHGNEFEGTDAALRLVEDYATSQDRAVRRLLERSRIHLVISMNPDGRHDNTRRNSAGFDLNRDFVTATQPETVAVRDALIGTQPVLMLDLHGYVNGTLVEPTTPPHGENYEYDLFIKHAYPNGLGMEEAINGLGYDEDDGVDPVQVPLRDWAEGWDDWPPIFTPQYAALHGAVAHTIEVPLRINNSSYDLPVEELQRRSAINTDIAHAAVTSTLEYAAAHRDELLADQIEIFRRGEAGEPQTPVEEGLFDGVIGPEDVYTTTYPRAYVIPVGDRQRSAPAAARLVEHLLANDVEVTRLTRRATLSGRSYPAGSYVVDMHQAKRGMAGTLLGPGSDISDRVDAMYDISGWSHALLWGADVVTVPAGDPLRLRGRVVDEVDIDGSLPRSRTGWMLPMADPADVQAVSLLLEQGIPLELLDDGRVLVPRRYPWAAGNVVSRFGVELSAAPRRASGEPLEASARVVGVAGSAEERWAFAEMGLAAREVSSEALNEGLDLSDLDALYVSSGLAWEDLEDGARAELQEFVADGGGLVGRGVAGTSLGTALGVIEATSVRGRGDANGVVRVRNDDESPVTSAATRHAFIYSPVWFTDLGEDVRVDQRLAEDPLASGHWRSTPSGEGGPDAGAGQPVVVSDESDDSRTVLLGTEPLFRAHPKGQYALVARALLWAGAHD
ncbi:M14 family zinc carboxypeptidase [Serinicoccus kebangsaanensis]|uniref:M14 family zinc carboxypeptidase n=1 Tax=Serinicoccus kebangsaanensis TaxID=2602069 RepID=UPI00124C7594|nr:M14 family zinc carboxypeptidase [Serinicoccus kebangsaanensis]